MCYPIRVDPKSLSLTSFLSDMPLLFIFLVQRLHSNQNMAIFLCCWQVSTLFLFDFDCKHGKHKTAFRARKIFGTLEKRAPGSALLALVVQTLDSKDNTVGFPNTYPLDSDLSSGKRYHPTFEQPGPGLTTARLAQFE